MKSLSNLTVDLKANVYFDGRVISHTLHLADGSRRTLGTIQPGSYHFGTDAAEQMDIIAGSCRVTLDGNSETLDYQAGQSFHVPASSGFTIAVDHGLCEYLCSFLND